MSHEVEYRLTVRVPDGAQMGYHQHAATLLSRAVRMANGTLVQAEVRPISHTLEVDSGPKVRTLPERLAIDAPDQDIFQVDVVSRRNAVIREKYLVLAGSAEEAGDKLRAANERELSDLAVPLIHEDEELLTAPLEFEGDVCQL